MTLASELTKVQYNGDGSTTAFTIPFVFYENSGIKAILFSVAGVETTQVLDTDYTLSGGNGLVGTLTMTTAPASGETLTIKSDIDDTQDTSLPLGGALASTAIELRLDILTRLVQQKEEEVSRTLLLAESTATSLIGLTFPAPGAGKFIKWNDAGTAIIAASSATLFADDDNDTKIQVEESADEDIIRFDVAGVEVFNIGATSGFVFNETGLVAYDFRVESDLNTHMFFVDSGNNSVHIDNLLLTGAGDGDLVMANTNSIQWINNAGTTSANSGISLSTSDDLLLKVPTAGDDFILQWSGLEFIRFGKENGGAGLLFVKESTTDHNTPVTNNGVIYTKDVSGDTELFFRNSSAISQISNLQIDGGTRSLLQYGTANTIRLRDTIFPMAGFRYHGRYRKSIFPTFTSVTQETSVSVITDLAFGMSTVVLENWYAVFACANDGDANVTFRLVPYLRIKSDLGGGKFDLNAGGEAQHSASLKTYTWAADALNGVECLMISEKIQGRDNAFSGRETTIIDSTPTTVTFADAGLIEPFDYFLPAPTDEFTHYRYCCSFYFDTAEVRNIADSGHIVQSRGTFDQGGTNTGSVASFERRNIGGYISPLATAVLIRSSGSLSTASTGQYVENFSTDSSEHTIDSFDLQKDSSSTVSFSTASMILSFSFGQQYFYRNGGLSSTRVNGQPNLAGFIEP